MTRKFQIVESVPKEFGAGAKAPTDAYAIAEAVGFSKVLVKRRRYTNHVGQLLSRLAWVLDAIRNVIRMPYGAVVFIQYPMNYLRSRIGVMFLQWLWRIRKVKFITLIHDINQLRGIAGKDDDEALDNIARISSVMIVHNDRMMSWLAQQGVATDKMVNLEIFDYLADVSFAASNDSDFKCMTLAGNLGLWGKCPFIRHLKTITDVDWHLYGAGFDAKESGGANISYHGSFSPKEITRHLTRGFGLVWDGDSVETCSGGWGEYLRFNNPHKMSMYLAAGLPVVIWDEAAQASFVKKYNVGFTVKSLADIGSRLRNMDADEYAQLRKNAIEISSKISDGGFLMDALKSALDLLDA